MSLRPRAAERLLRAAPFLATGLVLVLLWTLVLWFMTAQRHRLLAESEHALQLITRAVAEQTSGLLADATTGLRALDEWQQEHPAQDPWRAPALARLAETLGHGHTPLLTLGIADADGTWRDWTPAPRDAAPFVLDTARPHAAGDATVLAPQRRGSDWVLPVARPLRGRPGMAVALIDIDRLTALHDAMRLQPAGSIVLIRSDGIVVSRAPRLDGLVGRDVMARSPQVGAILARPEGSFHSSGVLTDGIERQATFRRLPGQPLTLIATQGHDAALATYHERRRIVLTVCGVFTVLVAAALAVLARANRRNRATQQALLHSEATLRAVAEAMPAVVAVVDAGERYVFANSGFERWIGRPREQLVGQTVREVLGEADYARRADWIRRVFAGEPVAFETEYDGTRGPQWRHLRFTYTPLRLPDGTPAGFIGIGSDITEHRTEEARLREIARNDPLTGVLNRAGLEQAYAERARRGNDGLRALLYIDLDRFKEINDEHGHGAGDRVLTMFCQRLRALVRPTDVVARLGGDEFVVILDALHEPRNAALVADKIVAAAQAPFRIDAHALRIGASVGTALWRGEPTDLQDLLRRADAMLYRAKEAGRGRHCLEA